MARVDFYDDADAPLANSLVVAASAVVVDDARRVLVHRRRDNGLWALPGGGLEYGESIADCAVRETREETGFVVSPLHVIGVYSDPRHVFAYDDGEVRQEFSVCVACELVGGELAVSDESVNVAWMTSDEIRSAPMHSRIRVRINDYFGGRRGHLD